MSSKVHCAEIAKAKTAQRSRRLQVAEAKPRQTWADVPIEVLARAEVSAEHIECYYTLNAR